MNVITLAEAKAAGLKRYFTGVPCVHGHVEERQTSSASCFACQRESKTKRSTATEAKDAERKRLWHLTYRERELERRREDYAANKARRQAVNSAYRAARKAEQAARRKVHYQANSHTYKSAAIARRDHVKRATPPWADLEAIAAVYAEAARLQESTGVPHNVDHFYPLRGGLVCGLHTLANLRVITKAENMAKKDRMPEHEECTF